MIHDTTITTSEFSQEDQQKLQSFLDEVLKDRYGERMEPE